jgi:vitamin B12 transporter
LDAQDETAKSLGSLLSKKVKNESYGVYSFTNFGNRKLFFDFGGRAQKYKFFGDNFTYKLGAGSNIGNFYTKASFSTGFKAPSLYQSHGPFVGNTELVAEESESLDLTIGIRKSSLKAEINVFSIHYDNFIDYDLVTSGYINDDDISIKGIELSIEKSIANSFQVISEFTVMRTKDKKNGQYLARRPREKGRLEISYIGHDNLNLSLEAEYVGRRNDTSQVLPGYVLGNFRTSYTISSEENIYFKLDNLLNKNYEEAINFGTAGRSFQIGYKVSI